MRLLAKVSLCCFVLAALVLASASTSAVAQDKAKDKKKEVKKVEFKVKVGDAAPAFESVDENGKTFKSTDVVGKKILVLYFYPADFTGGCTAQACGFRDDIEKLGSKKIAVVGVSGDSVATHKLFSKFHKLPFPLLADEKAELAKLFGIPHTIGKGTAKGVAENGEKIDVVRSATIQRYTVIIGLDGKVVDIGPGTAGGDAKRVQAVVGKDAK